MTVQGIKKVEVQCAAIYLEDPAPGKLPGYRNCERPAVAGQIYCKDHM